MLNGGVTTMTLAMKFEESLNNEQYMFRPTVKVPYSIFQIKYRLALFIL